MKKNIVFIIAGLFFAFTAHAETTATATAGVAAGAPSTVSADAGTAVATPTISQDLDLGSRGDEVKLLQGILIKAGLLTEDSKTGFFGERTKEAVKKWQEENKLPSVGRIGPMTRMFINGKKLEVMKAISEGQIPATVTSNASATAMSKSPVFNQDLTVGAHGDAVLKLQKFLILKKLLSEDSTTGFFGEKTREAVKKWQEEHKLPSAGFVGPMTRELLNKEGDNQNEQDQASSDVQTGEHENANNTQDSTEHSSTDGTTAASATTESEAH